MLTAENKTVQVGNVKFGADQPIAVIAGPCSVESQEGLDSIAREVKAAGAAVLRGGTYKLRTSPYTFQGLGEEGLKLLCSAGKSFGMPVVSEIISENDIEKYIEYVDMLQIGARNMQNVALLKAAGRSKKPVLLKRGMSAAIDEWIMAAEYIINEGNPSVIMCERGIRTFENATRNTFDPAAIAIVKRRTGLPVIADPSHAAGSWDLVEAVSLAAIAAGADGLLIEVHDSPDEARSDGYQSLKPDNFAALMEKARLVARAVGRTL